MKIYIIEHSYNEEYALVSHHEINSAFRHMEGAERRLLEICEQAAKGTLPYFYQMDVKRVPSDFRDGLIYEWKSEDGRTFYSHFYITEVELN